MIEGPGGILMNSPPKERPVYEPSKRRLTWPNGTWATIYSDGEPEQTRGFSGDTAWLDEFAKYRYPQIVWDNLQFGMREASADRPRQLITTTPRPLALLRTIEALPDTVVVTGSSYENRSNLDRKWFDKTIAQYEGTRFGRQEIHAEILDDVPGALWTRRNLDEYRVKEAPDLERIVVALDPPATGNDGSNEAGIIVAGLATNKDGFKHGYTLDDWSTRGSPEEWGRRAVAAYHRYEADRIVAESNQGGEMVEHVIKSVDRDVPVTLVQATRGKYVRAEPVSALYEQGRIHHVGTFAELEDQMASFTPETSADRSKGLSPDRVDALVWAYSDLFPQLTARARPDRPPPTKANSAYSITRWRAGR
jgi:phage terminase large subunit-like protein